MRNSRRTIPLCLVCRFYHDRRTGPATCNAYPGGIPAMILDGRVIHQGPLPGDSGIQFEADPKAPESIVALFWACQRSARAARGPSQVPDVPRPVAGAFGNGTADPSGMGRG